MIEKYTPAQVAALIRSVDPSFHDPTAEQAAIISIVTNPFEPAVVIAGAGSGKTETMASRVIYLVANEFVKPDEILFVVDAMIGQDAVRTAKAFQDGVGFDGVVLTKLDGDARGGAALSIAKLTGQPIMFSSNGEKLTDFDIFYPDRMASRILGMGDVATLAEQAKKALDTDSSAKIEEKFARGDDFTLEDFLEQLEAMSKMGSMSKLLGMLPGAGAMKKQIENFDESEIVRTKSIVQSMTPLERQDPKVLNGSRRARIALGAGRKVQDVNSLVDKFSAAQKMMRQMRNGGGMPPAMAQSMGMPAGMGSGSVSSKKSQAPAKKKSKSGNPAKRAAEERG
jgi:signal recognition particle subunit SRP54